MLQPAVEFTAPTAADADELVANMRHQDVAECYAAGHDDLRAVVLDGIRRSVQCWTARVDGRMAAIFGVAPYGTLTSNIGVPWLLGTPEVPKHRRILARHARPYIAGMLAVYPHLLNAVHAENTVAVHWLQRMGFKLGPAFTAPSGATFYTFEMRK